MPADSYIASETWRITVWHDDGGYHTKDWRDNCLTRTVTAGLRGINGTVQSTGKQLDHT